jgi:hypothetical protein
MTIATYSDLQTAIASWLARDDLTARIPDFIMLFEAVANRRLRVRQMETVVTLTPSSGTATLPADYLNWRRVTWTGSPRNDLDYVHPSILQDYYPTVPAGIPRLFTIEGSSLKVRPVDDTGLEFDYLQKIPALASVSTNWLLTEHPDLYLFGSLAEAQGFNVDFEKLGVWKARRDELFDEIIRLSNLTRGVGAVRVAGATP